jgi:hypothetical protein
MRKRYIQHPETLKLIPAEEYIEPADVNAPMVMPDIQPYQSMVDGTYITSRSHHRAHLKQHRVIEIGNETKHLMAQAKRPSSPPGLKDALVREFNRKGL